MLTICSRDLNSLTGNTTKLKASRVFTHHTASVNDVQYHPLHKSLIGTVSDDYTVQILDLRKSSNDTAQLKGYHQETAVNTLAFNPASDYIFATGCNDSTIGIWDLRNLKSTLHILRGHEDHVTSLAWHPFEEAILGSGCSDRRIIFWDLSRVGEEQLPEDVEDGVPEL